MSAYFLITLFGTILAPVGAVLFTLWKSKRAVNSNGQYISKNKFILTSLIYTYVLYVLTTLPAIFQAPHLAYLLLIPLNINGALLVTATLALIEFLKIDDIIATEKRWPGYFKYIIYSSFFVASAYFVYSIVIFHQDELRFAFFAYIIAHILLIPGIGAHLALRKIKHKDKQISHLSFITKPTIMSLSVSLLINIITLFLTGGLILFVFPFIISAFFSSIFITISAVEFIYITSYKKIETNLQHTPTKQSAFNIWHVTLAVLTTISTVPFIFFAVRMLMF